MGYCVSMEINVRIHESNEKLVFKIFKDLKKDEKKLAGGGSSSGEKWYSWVDVDFADKEDVIFSFDKWRYEVEKEGEYYVVSYFSGEKLGQDALLWERMAPAIEDGSVIECQGEDGCLWKWVFNHGKMKEFNGQVVFEDEKPSELDNLLESVDKADPYKLLGVSKKSTKAEVQKAYKKIIQQYHPDKVSHLAKEFQVLAEKKTKQLNEAVKIILDKI